MHGNELIIRPVRTVSSGEFAEQILSELIDEGLSGADSSAGCEIHQKTICKRIKWSLL